MKQWESICVALLCFAGAALAAPTGQHRLTLAAEQVASSSPLVDFSFLVDEQSIVGDPPTGNPQTPWKALHGTVYPVQAIIDLGVETPLATLWIYDTYNVGDVIVKAGTPGAWEEVGRWGCNYYMSWAKVPLDVSTRYLMLEVQSGGAIFTEVALDAYTPEGWTAFLEAKAEAERIERERQEALARAEEEARNRPIITMEPFGRLSLIDTITPTNLLARHKFLCDPAGAVTVTNIFGKATWVIEPTEGECAYFVVCLAEMSLLSPGTKYVLAVEYPEDAPRSMSIHNLGCETIRGIHTGQALGDAFLAKYVDPYVESVSVPLSGTNEVWTAMFQLHDRYPARKMMGRSSGVRSAIPEDGVDVIISQFAKKHIPGSKGAAVSAIRLYEVLDIDTLPLAINYPPAALPRRHIFWREEMADGVLTGAQGVRGVNTRTDWYKYKMELMKFLGINTFTKDLFEFGHCQHWDPSAYGTKWMNFDNEMRNLWEDCVIMAGQYGFDVFPYYEYSGSRGPEGLGTKRTPRPLTRTDGKFIDISWVDAGLVDLTAPEAYDDFKKVLDLTIIKFKDQAHILGAWIRPRMQMPVSFSDETIARFVAEANSGTAVTRAQIAANTTLYKRYLDWWEGKRRDFFIAMRDYLRENGVDDAVILFTGCPAEPGTGFGNWRNCFVTDTIDWWKTLLTPDSSREYFTPAQIAQQDIYLTGLLAPGATWGGWEFQHVRPSDDPQRYKNDDGIFLSHAFNRLYTVAAPKTLDLFRGKKDLAIVRHYALNENMMYNVSDQEKIGYYVCDFERAGDSCMQAEAVAVANGDPTMIGYLMGNSFNRGYPSTVRDFNANYLALPALPSTVLPQAANNPAVVVRSIFTQYGTYLAVVNTSWLPVSQVTITLPQDSKITRLATNQTTEKTDSLTLDLRPYQLVALRLDGPLILELL